jgi:hypothetical protein
VTARPALVALVLAALAISGCQPMISSPAEYASFRQTRVAPTVEGRLQASARYLEEYPSGHWSKPVRGWLLRADRIYFKAKRGSAAGLQAYLRAVPTGAHRAEARRMLATLSAQRAAQQEAGEDLARAGSATEARLAGAERARQETRATVDAWLRRFLGLDAWRGPFREAPAELATAWKASPEPTCQDTASGRRCQKVMDLAFTIPVGGRAEPRALTLIVDTREDVDGKLVEVLLRGQQLFARLQETATTRPYDRGTTAGYDAAVRHGVELVDAAFEALVAAPAQCELAMVPPVVRDLECRGARVTVGAGVAEADEDRIAIRRTPAR